MERSEHIRLVHSECSEVLSPSKYMEHYTEVRKDSGQVVGPIGSDDSWTIGSGGLSPGRISSQRS